MSNAGDRPGSHNQQTDPFIEFSGITVRRGGRLLLPETSWEILGGQHWAVLGPNGAGKSSLVGVLTGQVPYVRGSVARGAGEAKAECIGYVSFEEHERCIARDESLDEGRYFAGRWNTLGRARETILGSGTTGTVGMQFDDIVALLDIDHLLDRAIRCLSTGEMRRVLIARALMKTARLLILDEPFDALDRTVRRKLAHILERLMDAGIQVVLVTHRMAEISDRFTHVIALRDGRVQFQGKRQAVMNAPNIDRLYGCKAAVRLPSSVLNSYGRTSGSHGGESELVRMRHTTVKYSGVRVLSDLNWCMRSEQHWAIVGPNGAGKSTLLNLISGDHPQAYANEIYLFGRRRGSGESIWEIKRRIGAVSAEMQIRYRKRLSALDTVLSGFFDSVGLYRRASVNQRMVAREWFNCLGIDHLADRWIDRLSYGEKRLVLLARAMVKCPQLLILDEPCQGLDRENRRRILDVIDLIGRCSPTHLLYVTHRADEMPTCMTHVLELPSQPQAGVRIRPLPVRP